MLRFAPTVSPDKIYHLGHYFAFVITKAYSLYARERLTLRLDIVHRAWQNIEIPDYCGFPNFNRKEIKRECSDYWSFDFDHLVKVKVLFKADHTELLFPSDYRDALLNAKWLTTISEEHAHEIEKKFFEKCGVGFSPADQTQVQKYVELLNKEHGFKLDKNDVYGHYGNIGFYEWLSMHLAGLPVAIRKSDKWFKIQYIQIKKEVLNCVVWDIIHGIKVILRDQSMKYLEEEEKLYYDILDKDFPSYVYFPSIAYKGRPLSGSESEFPDEYKINGTNKMYPKILKLCDKYELDPTRPHTWINSPNKILELVY